MPTSRMRRRVEIDDQLHARLKALATREGYPVSRFIDKLLYAAVDDYIAARQSGVYPFAELGIGLVTNPIERSSE